MKEVFLLRGSQLSLVIGGLLLILIGSGVHTDWIRPLAFATIIGGIAGFIYESRLRRGEGNDIAALLLPAAGVMSSIFVLMVNV